MARIDSLGPLLFTLIATACGGSSTADGSNTGGTSTGGTSTGGTGGKLPDACVVSTAEPAPHAVTFRFNNTSGSSLYIVETCFLDYTVKSCADGYVAEVQRDSMCTELCSANAGCLACGACAWLGKEIPTGTSLESTWEGYSYTLHDIPGMAGCQCHERHEAPAGRYRVEVDVYASAIDAETGQAPLRTVPVDFELPAPNGIVDIALNP